MPRNIGRTDLKNKKTTIIGGVINDAGLRRYGERGGGMGPKRLAENGEESSKCGQMPLNQTQD